MDTPVDWALPHAEAVLDGPVTAEVVKARPWATSWRLTGPRGVAYLKAGAAATAYEAGLTAALARVAPDMVPAAIAVDADAGRVLLADAGPTLREVAGEGFDLSVWRPLLTRFANLQRTAEPVVGELSAVPHERPSDFPGILARLVAASPRFASLTPEEKDGVSRLGDRWLELAARLERYGMADSVQHGDLHDGNVAVGADGHARFFDFGDASVSHPFTTMLIPLRVAGSLGATADDLVVLKEAYLDGYADLAPMDELAGALEIALRIAPVVRVTSWDRALSGPAAEGDDPYARPEAWGDAAAEWLRELLVS